MPDRSQPAADRHGATTACSLAGKKHGDGARIRRQRLECSDYAPSDEHPPVLRIGTPGRRGPGGFGVSGRSSEFGLDDLHQLGASVAVIGRHRQPETVLRLHHLLRSVHSASCAPEHPHLSDNMDSRTKQEGVEEEGIWGGVKGQMDRSEGMMEGEDAPGLLPVVVDGWDTGAELMQIVQAELAAAAGYAEAARAASTRRAYAQDWRV
ncbi:MAG: hypothetical protein ACRYFE_13780, partial [Janthinobacterium lividum]